MEKKGRGGEGREEGEGQMPVHCSITLSDLYMVGWFHIADWSVGVKENFLNVAAGIMSGCLCARAHMKRGELIFETFSFVCSQCGPPQLALGVGLYSLTGCRVAFHLTFLDQVQAAHALSLELLSGPCRT